MEIRVKVGMLSRSSTRSKFGALKSLVSILEKSGRVTDLDKHQKDEVWSISQTGKRRVAETTGALTTRPPSPSLT
jgi:muramoyltetrapeptide carboxypeptidase LdcA involved in peptidoglycan recycling